MPFAGPADPKLPSNVSGLSLEKRRQWVGAWNGRFDDCQADGGSTSDCESSAFAVANAAIKELGMPEDNPEAGAVNTAPAKVRYPGDEGEDWSSTPGRPDYWDYQARQIEQPEAEYDPIGATDTKACANCQWFIAPNGCAVVVNYPQPILPTGLSNLWLERVMPESRPLEVMIVEAELGEKAQHTKTEGGVEYAASDYAVVPDAAKPSTWKLRLAAGSSGAITVAQVARAITAMQPGGFRGNRVQLTADQKSQAVGRIGTAIGKTDGSDDQKQNLRDRLDKVKESSTIERTLQAVGKALPERLRNLLNTMHAKTKRPSGRPAMSSLKVYKDANGDTRFVAWASNKWRDRDYPPEILSQAAHKEYVAYLDGGGAYPEMWLWHTPGTKWGAVDWADYADGFLIVSGTVDEGNEALAETLAKDADLGVSHGFAAAYEDGNDGIIGRYRTFEVSPLPHGQAANPWTSLEVIKKEVDMGFTDPKRLWLVEHLGEAVVAQLEDGTKDMADVLTAAGVEFKDVPEGVGTPDPDPKPQPAGAESPAAEFVKALAESETWKALQEGVAGLTTKATATDEAIAALTTRVDDIAQSDDHKFASLITSRARTQAKAVNGQRASESVETVVDAKGEETEGAAAIKERNSEFFDGVMEGVAGQAHPV